MNPPKNNPVPENAEDEMYYSQPLLGTVLGLQEVIAMWGVTRRTVEMAVWKNKLESRKLITGGGYLVTRESVVRLWGPPVHDYTDGLLHAGRFIHVEDEV